MKRLLLFTNDARQYSVELSFVKSIHGTDGIRRDAHQTPVLQVNGYEIPLIDMSAFLCGGQTELDSTSGKLMVFEQCSLPFALKVDQIERIISVEDDQIDPMPQIFKGHSLSCFPSVIKQDNEMILTISPDGFVRKLFPETFMDSDQESSFCADMDEIETEIQIGALEESSIESIPIQDDNLEVELSDEPCLEPVLKPPVEMSDSGLPVTDEFFSIEKEDHIGVDEGDDFSDAERMLAAVEPPEQKASDLDIRGSLPEEDEDIILLTEEIEVAPVGDDPKNKLERLEHRLIELFQEQFAEENLIKLASGVLQEYVAQHIYRIKQTLKEKVVPYESESS